MAKADLTVSRLQEFVSYDPNTGFFTRVVGNNRNTHAGDVAGTVHRTGYVYLMIDRKTYAAHRLAWFYMFGAWPANDIDHINGNKSDNRLANLRDLPTKLNCQNERSARKNNPTGLMGVQFRKGRQKWTATVRVEGKSYRLGSFSTAEEAHAAYIDGKRALHIASTV
jgi:hypothetical protein